MQIVGINGSHRAGRNTAKMLATALDEAAARGAQTRLLEITEFHIEYCKNCNKCLRQTKCSIEDDDMARLGEILIQADGIILASPSYFGNVTGRMKTLMDRTRWMHMVKNLLQGKVGGAIVHAGMRNGGQETTLMLLERFLRSHGLIIVGGFEPLGEDQPRELISLGAISTLFAGHDGRSMNYYRSVEEDPLAMQTARLLGQNMVAMLHRLGIE